MCFFFTFWWAIHPLTLNVYVSFVACATVFCVHTQYTRRSSVVRRGTRSYIICSLFCRWCNSPTRTKASFLLRFLHDARLDTHTSSCGMNISSQRSLPTQHTTNTRERQTDTPVLSLIRTHNSSNQRLQIYTLDRTGTGIAHFMET